MEHVSSSPSHERNGCFTVAVATLLTLRGIVGIAVGLAAFGLQPGAWMANAPMAVPDLVSAVLNLLAGTALGFSHYRRAAWFLAFALVARISWWYLARWGWDDTGSSGLELIGLLLALWLHRNGPGARREPEGSCTPAR